MQLRKTHAARTLHDGRWWGAHTDRFSFRTPDQNDAADYNRLLREGVVGQNVGYPEDRSGRDLAKITRRSLGAARSPLDTAR